jgi:hypothetical protein
MNVRMSALRMSAVFFATGAITIICLYNGFYKNESIKLLIGSTAVSSIFMFIVTAALYLYAKKHER